ncbi:carboxylesterase family protein [Cupriavidus sp. RAF12]|uniref:carboxylesterase family protein n=1 Tax=Cupriavidus sp. RAF12 TaxID=3233050 RepID=UPI003F908C1C
MKVAQLVAAVVAGAFVISASAASALAVVKTENGEVSGTGDSVMNYRGIPYAASPEGKLWWKLPQPAHPWARDALRGARISRFA